jgi:hypothetical protein
MSRRGRIVTGIVVAAATWAAAVVPLGYLAGRWLRRATQPLEPETAGDPTGAPPEVAGDLTGAGPDDGQPGRDVPDRSRA